MSEREMTPSSLRPWGLTTMSLRTPGTLSLSTTCLQQILQLRLPSHMLKSSSQCMHRPCTHCPASTRMLSGMITLSSMRGCRLD